MTGRAATLPVIAVSVAVSPATSFVVLVLEVARTHEQPLTALHDDDHTTVRVVTGLRVVLLREERPDGPLDRGHGRGVILGRSLLVLRRHLGLGLALVAADCLLGLVL